MNVQSKQMPAGTVVPIGMRMVPAGEFYMGSEDPAASPYERPVHTVWTDAFAIGEAPVTNEEFDAYAEDTEYMTVAERVAVAACPGEIVTWRSHAGPGREDHPVVLVAWEDAVSFCHWKQRKTGLPFRLPTEAEWEKAARGGLLRKLYPWGDDEADGRACWNRWHLPIGTMPVRSFAPNTYGLYDMAGSVWEWCNDWYEADYYLRSTGTNPTGPAEGQYRVRRGAAWNIREPFRMRCANRGAMAPDQFWPNMGFRYALSPTAST